MHALELASHGVRRLQVCSHMLCHVLFVHGRKHHSTCVGQDRGSGSHLQAWRNLGPSSSHTHGPHADVVSRLCAGVVTAASQPGPSADVPPRGNTGAGAAGRLDGKHRGGRWVLRGMLYCQKDCTVRDIVLPEGCCTAKDVVLPGTLY